MSDSITQLNSALGRALGYNPFGDPLFKWAWCHDLWWPETATGRTVQKPIDVPLIGGGFERTYIVVPEYKKTPMCQRLTRQFVVCRWMPPEELERWGEIFPHADYPSRGYYVNTDYFRGRDNPPDLADTECFIRCAKEQRSMKFNERLRDMEAEADKKESDQRKVLEDEMHDLIPAFCHGTPGKRSGDTSFPSLKKDLVHVPTN